MLLSLIKKDLLLTWKYILLMAALCCFYPLFILHNLIYNIIRQAVTRIIAGKGFRFRMEQTEASTLCS